MRWQHCNLLEEGPNATMSTIFNRLILKETQLKENQINLTIFILFSNSKPSEMSSVAISANSGEPKKRFNIQVPDAEKCDRRGGNMLKDASLSQRSVYDCDPAR